MSDVLYILGRGSKHDDLELRLSLRCLEKNSKNIDKVFIVGNCPEWVQNVVHIPAEDTYQREQNHFQKVFRAIEGGISDNFLLMNDDFFMLKSFDVRKYPYYVRGYLERYENPSRYQIMLNNTLKYLKNMGINNPLAYNVHCPIIYNGKDFYSLKGFAEEHKRDDIGYSPRILYGNLFIKKGVVVDDCKMHKDGNISVGKTCCLSTSDYCDNILKEIEIMYNKKSRWEK